jgi:hypothetical protein
LETPTINEDSHAHPDPSTSRSATVDADDSTASSGRGTVVAEDTGSDNRPKTHIKTDDASSSIRDNEKNPIDLGDGKVAVGKDAATGKFVVIDKRYMEGGPYSKPKW